MLLKYDVEPTLETRPHSFAIRKSGAPTLHLAADSDDVMARWCAVILEAVERNSQVCFICIHEGVLTRINNVLFPLFFIMSHTYGKHFATLDFWQYSVTSVTQCDQCCLHNTIQRKWNHFNLYTFHEVSILFIHSFVSIIM